jgi:hypothetical protein
VSRQSRQSLRITVFVAVVAPAFLGACRDQSPPPLALGSPYVLTSLDGQPPPVLQYDSGVLRQYLAADTLKFYEDGTYSDAVVSRIDSVGKTYTALQQGTGTGHYRLRGDSIDFAFTCPPNASCIAPPAGSRSLDGAITVAYRSNHGLVFVRRFEPTR